MSEQPNPTPSPLHLTRRALRYSKMALALLVITVAATLFVARRSSQTFRSEAVILYRQNARQSYGELDSSRRVGTRLMDMLFARDRLLSIVRDLRVYPNVASPHEAADLLKKKITFLVRDGSTFVIAFDGESPQIAQAVTQRLAESLIADNNRQRADEAERTRLFLDSEKRRLEEDVRTKETALADFLQRNPEAAFAHALPPTTAGGGPAGLLTAEREMERLRGRTTERPVARMDAEVLAIQRRAELEAVTAQRDFADKEQKLTDVHPDLIVARERVRLADAHLRQLRLSLSAASEAEERNTVAATAKNDASSEIAALERELGRIRRSARVQGAARINRHALRTEVELDSLRHDLVQARERLAGLEDKEFQASLLARLETSGQVGQVMVLDPAYLPGLPFVDTKKKITLIGVALAFMLSAGWALLRARTDDRLFDRTDVEWLSGKPVLTVVPVLSPASSKRRAHG